MDTAHQPSPLVRFDFANEAIGQEALRPGYRHLIDADIGEKQLASAGAEAGRRESMPIGRPDPR